MTNLPNLPGGWAWSTVEEVGTVQLGRQRSPKHHSGPHMRPYLRVANVFEDRIDTSDVMSMNFEPDEFERYRLHPGDVLLNEGQSPELLGRPALYRGEPSNVAFTNSLIRFRAAEGISPEWALLVFRRHMRFGRFARESRITTNIAHLSATRFKTVEFPVPPIAEQRRITDAVSKNHELIDTAMADVLVLRQRVARLTDAVLNDVLRRAHVSAGKTTATADVADITGGLQKQPKRHPTGQTDGLPFLRVANVGRRTLDLTDVHRILVTDAERDRVTLRPGDLLVVEGNGSPDQIGRAALWQGSIRPCTHQNHLIRVRSMESLIPDFLELVWNAPSTVMQLKEVASTTSGLYTLSTKKVGNVQIPVPSLAVQEELVAEAEERFGLADVTLRDLDSLRRRLDLLRGAVLANALAGRLLPQDANDEPADLLLKRNAENRAATSAPRAQTPRTVAKALTSQRATAVATA